VVLLGWHEHLELLKAGWPGWPAMKPNTALGMILSGASLVLLGSRWGSTPRGRVAITVPAALVLMLGLVTLGENFFGWQLGIDEALFRDTSGSLSVTGPARPTPGTAFSFVLVGIALLAACHSPEGKWRRTLVAALGVSVFTIGGLNLAGHFSDFLSGVTLWQHTGMALPTAGGFLLIGLSLLAWIQGRQGWTWALDITTTTGVAAGLVCLLVTLGLSYYFIDRLYDTSHDAAESQAALRTLAEIGANLAMLDQGLAPASRIGPLLATELSDLEQDLRDDPAGLPRLADLKPLIAAHLAPTAPRGAPATNLSAETGIELQALRDAETARLDRETAAGRTAATRAFLLLPTGAYLGLTLLFVELFFLNAGGAEEKQAERRLREQLKNVTDLRYALDEHAIVAMTDAAGKIIYANEKFCALSKYSRHELLGQDHRILNSGHHSKAFMRELWATIEDGRVWHGEIRNRAKDGTNYWVDTTIVPFLGEDGRPERYATIRADITNLKRAEEASARLAAIIASSNEAIIGKNLDGIITTWNAGAEKLFGYTAAEIVGRSILRIIPSDRADEEARIIDYIRRGETLENFDTLRRRKDGRLIDVSITASPIRDKEGRIIGVSKIAHEITDRKRAEAEIHELAASLERRVAERTGELEAANKELEAFSYSVSHDLRAPLRTVDGFSQAVLEDYGPQLPDQGRQDLLTIRQGAQRMGRLIDDLLAFAQLSRTPLSKRLIDTGAQVRQVLENLRPQLAGREIDLEIGALPPCQGSPAMLEQVWTNLLSNAIKYTQLKDRARIEVGCRHEDDRDVFFVRDNGDGFDMRYAHKLFGVFQRLHLPDQFEGTGVGLAIVQRIIHRHGGRIWAEAAPQQGATFFFTLQAAAGTPETAP
jgi:PAS domain S-box-containing protein